MGLKNIFISRNLKKVKRTIQFHNFETAKTIGLLFSVTNKQTYEIVKAYYNSFNKHEINALGFVNNPDEIGQTYFGQGNFNFFSEKHFSKFGKIKENCISDFVNSEFDILINLSKENNFYTDYVFGLSKAHFKVSGIINCKHSDLNINYNKNEDLNFFISQVNKYLKIIQKA